MGIANENGRIGEQVAMKFLIKKGYEIEGLNYRSPFGEIDIIASYDEYIVFVEVKTRLQNSDFLARDAVTYSKECKIISTADQYLSANDCEKQPRFDIIEVYLPRIQGEKIKVHHIENAF